MSGYPIAPSAARALNAGRRARTAADAEAQAGGPVTLAVAPLTGRYASLAAAEAAHPELYRDPAFEAVWIDGAWRVAVRFWRPAPAYPVARDDAAALTAPLAHARTEAEAAAALGAPAELVRALAPKRYRTYGFARAARRAWLEAELAQVVEAEGGFAVAVKYWRPREHAPAIAPAEREDLARRAAAPLAARTPQATPYVGLFERLAPENAAIVLAEEGDGRASGE